MARLAPGLPRGLTTCGYDAEDWHRLARDAAERLREIPDHDAHRRGFVSHEAHATWTTRAIAELRAAGARDPVLDDPHRPRPRPRRAGLPTT